MMVKKFIPHFIVNFFSKGHERSIRAKKNIALSFIVKGCNIAIGLVLVPLTIEYLSPVKYGVWITLSSVIGWFGFFDIGLGNGLRNKLTEAIANENLKLAKVYVSTTYAIISIIIISILFIFYFVNPFLNWNVILNVKNLDLKAELGLIVLIVFTFFCLRFILKLITTILTADQRPAKASLFDLIGRVLSLIGIYILTKTQESSLLYLCTLMSGMPVLVLCISSMWFFRGKYKEYTPSFKFVDFSMAGDLLNLGVKFFIIQIAAVLLYQTNNMVISHLFGPAEVTPYNVAFRYFNILMMGFSILVVPFWSAFTEAWAKRDVFWIKNAMNKLMRIWVILLVLGVIMLIISPWVYRFWVGTEIEVPFLMSGLVALWILIHTWNGIFGQFLNGVGKVKFQLYFGVISAFFNVPLSVFLGLRIGIEGVFLANVILGVLAALVYPIQYRKLINNRASGIWNE